MERETPILSRLYSPARGNSPVYCAIDLPQKSGDILAASVFVEKRFRRNIGLLENRAQCSFRHIPAVIGDSGVAMGGGVEPDFMRSARLAIELEAKLLQPLDDLPVSKAREPAHVAVVLIRRLARYAPTISG